MADYEGFAWEEADNPNPGDITVWLPDFKTAHAELGSKHEEKLRQRVKQLITDPIRPPYVSIIGSASQAGGSGYNQRLSENRAKQVRNFLLQVGVPSSRLPQPIGVGDSRSQTQDESADWWTERSVTIIISPNPLPRIILPRPRRPPPREHFPPEESIPHSNNFSIRMDFAGSISSALQRARIGRLLMRVLPMLRRFAGVMRGITFDIIVFTIRDRDHRGWKATYVYVAPGFSLGLSVDATLSGPWNDFSTHGGLVNLLQFGGDTSFGGMSIDVGPSGIGLNGLLMNGPLLNAGVLPVLILPFQAGPSLGASIGKTNGVMLIIDLLPIGLPTGRESAASTTGSH